MCQPREIRHAVWSLRTRLESTWVLQTSFCAPCDARLLNFRLKEPTCLAHANEMTKQFSNSVLAVVRMFLWQFRVERPCHRNVRMCPNCIQKHHDHISMPRRRVGRGTCTRSKGAQQAVRLKWRCAWKHSCLVFRGRLPTGTLSPPPPPPSIGVQRRLSPC